MTHDEILTELRAVAAEYVEAHRSVDGIDFADQIARGEAQVRFVIAIVAGCTSGEQDELGEAWTAAGRRFLDAIMRQVEDELHASRAARRVEL